MFGLTEEQRKLYDRLQNTIKDHGNVAEILQGVSKDDLLAVLSARGTTIEFKNGERYTKKLFYYSRVIKNQEGLKVISDEMTKKDISLDEILNAEIINIEFPNVVKFDGTPPEDKQMLFDELGDFVESFVESFAKGFNDKMKEKHEIETKQVTNKAIGIGITCGVIAALAVGVGCGVAGVQLSVLAIVGIAVAAALAVGIVAGVITYAVLKPSGRLEEAHAQEEKEKVPA
ncbi:hypothetical protein [Wolbachia endosymbiont (group A) of Sympetrum striolatum]|uniref:hypothetical protein n=1 Tax=Wolbachia endosymbiont (group A) of Sympetrum striolatum TaxID=2954061 RepID=UPI00222613C0|nr:hypothetical protein [Wolbachia endosymbiont (group A) of Sympetrum striolatum]